MVGKSESRQPDDTVFERDRGVIIATTHNIVIEISLIGIG
jgi:hypothetical protein